LRSILKNHQRTANFKALFRGGGDAADRITGGSRKIF
jgi:hypothetical protein